MTTTLVVFPQVSGAAPEGIPCTPEPTDMPIAYGDLVICQIDPPEDSDVFRFAGSEGEAISILVSRQGGGYPCVELLDPEMSRIGTSCGFSARVDARLTKNGTHMILVSDLLDGGPYALSLERVAPPTLSAPPVRFGQSLYSEINPSGDVDLYKFDALAGDTVSILISLQSGTGHPCVELFDPEGTRIGTTQCSSPGAGTGGQLVKNGTHTIRVSESGNDGTLGYQISLACTGQCPSAVFPTIAITLTGCTTCRAGDVFTASAAVTNPTARWLEAKLGVYMPDRTPVNLMPDKHLELPPGFTFDGEVFRITLPSGLPTGTYQFCALLPELELGRPVAESCQTFTIGP